MTSSPLTNLVERLREGVLVIGIGPDQQPLIDIVTANQAMRRAADRIEALETEVARLTRLDQEGGRTLEVCGHNAALPARLVGCGKPIAEGQDYRCTHCDVRFHKDCAERHFKSDNVLTQEMLDSITDEELAALTPTEAQPPVIHNQSSRNDVLEEAARLREIVLYTQSLDDAYAIGDAIRALKVEP